MSGYLEDTFLGAPVDDATMCVGSASNLLPLGEEPELVPAPRQMVQLPGGIVMPRQTAMLLLAVAVAVAIYLYVKRKKKD